MACRRLVDYLQGIFQVSIRRGCSVLGLQKSTNFYKARRPSQAALKKRIREIAETRVRYGYQRIHILLKRERVGSEYQTGLPVLCGGRLANPELATEAKGDCQTAGRLQAAQEAQ